MRGDVVLKRVQQESKQASREASKQSCKQAGKHVSKQKVKQALAYPVHLYCMQSNKTSLYTVNALV